MFFPALFLGVCQPWRIKIDNKASLKKLKEYAAIFANKVSQAPLKYMGSFFRQVFCLYIVA